MRASDLLPIPNFGDPAGCVAITGGPAPDMVLDSSSRGGTEIADVQKPEICSVEFRGQKSLEALPGSCASTADATAWRSSAGVASCPRETIQSQAKATEGKAGMAGAIGPVRRSTAGTGLRVGASARTDRLSMPALGYASNVSDLGVTAGETATNSPVTATRRLDDLGSVQDGLKMSTDGQPNAGLSSACIERPIEVGVTAGRDRQPIPDGRATAVRTFGPGIVLAKLEAELASFVVELNARDRLMRRHRLDYDDPPPLFLTRQRDDLGREHDQSIRSDTGSTLSQALRALSGRVLLPVHGERLP